MIWVLLDTITSAIDKDNYLNTELRSILSIFDWNVYEGPELALKKIEIMLFRVSIRGKLLWN